MDTVPSMPPPAASDWHRRIKAEYQRICKQKRSRTALEVKTAWSGNR